MDIDYTESEFVLVRSTHTARKNDSRLKKTSCIVTVCTVCLLPLQLHAEFLYADAVRTTGGQYSGSYPPENVMNNSFTSEVNTIDTTVNYLAAGNNYATAAGTTSNFDLIFDFALPTQLAGMYVWNYVYRNNTSGSSSQPPGINSFTSSTNVVQHPETLTLYWDVESPITSLEIIPDVGDVLPLATNGTGSVSILPPLGYVKYILRVNGGAYEQEVEVVGLPEKGKLHLYLLIGQSNMGGNGRPRDPVLDAADPRVLQFGSRDGMEETWLLADHPLTDLPTGGNKIGMGIEFAKTLLADIGDTNIVIGLINHALGSTAIQWWAPGAPHTKQNNPQTGQPYYLYDEAIQRIKAASTNGTIKGVLWHQGEYNANNNSNPNSEPSLYAGRLQSLVDNLRTDLRLPDLPFVCGKFVPAVWTNDLGQTITFTGLPNRGTVEAALADLPNQRANTFCVDNAGLRGHDDEMIHFDAGSQRLLGQRYAEAILSLTPDADADGLPDTWELAYWGHRTNANDKTASDADAHSDLEEYVANTDPTNSASFFRIKGIEIPDDVHIQFDSSTNRRYTLQVTDDLTGLAWSNVSGQVLRLGLGTNDVMTGTSTTDKHYYRLKASLP